MNPSTVGTIILICLVLVVEARVHVRETKSRRRDKPQILRKYP